ncbi:MAG: hypothetical protein HZB20_11300 [Chloroflexi bacterium]|nr:hypothetical protein [Chloroflexota bacterium]
MCHGVGAGMGGRGERQGQEGKNNGKTGGRAHGRFLRWLVAFDHTTLRGVFKGDDVLRSLAVGTLGNVTTETLRAFDEGELAATVGRMP